jgi:hypothetical protein
MGINGKHRLETRVREEEKITQVWPRAAVTGVFRQV